jgi:hypothetical protein
LPSRNLDTNPKELYAPKSTPKNPKRDCGDKKKKKEILTWCYVKTRLGERLI